MAFPFAFSPSAGVNDTTQFPDDDPQIRAHLQNLFNQTRDFINTDVQNQITLSQYKSIYAQGLINANFDFWQRGTSFTSVGYTADRWLASHDGTVTKTYSQQSFTPGQSQVPNNPKYFLRSLVASASGQTSHTIGQKIEDVNTFAGMQVSVSFYAKADTVRNLNVNFKQEFGTGGSSSVLAGSDVQFTLSTAWQKFTATFNIPSISGKTIGANSDLLFYFGLPLNTSFTIDIAQVQVNVGSIALPFTPKTYSQELQDCKRYYQKIGYVALATSSDGAVLTQKNFPVEMRVAPTIYLTDSEAAINTNGYVYDYNGNTAIAGFTASQISSRGFVTILKTSGCTAGRLYGGGAVLDAEL